MSDQLHDFISGLDFTPGSPAWQSMSAPERFLATFAALMNDHLSDGLYNVAFSRSGDEILYCDALRRIGAPWLADNIEELVGIEDTASEAARTRLALVCQNIETRYSELWGAASAYALANLPSSLWED